MLFIICNIVRQNKSNIMKLVKHRNLESLLKQAQQDNQEIFETPISLSYRIFNEQGNTIRMNIFYK